METDRGALVRTLVYGGVCGTACTSVSVDVRLEGATDRPDDEAKIVARVQRGDREAFGALVRGYAQRAYAVAYCVLQHREDAEDVVQESYIAALDAIDTFERGRPFAPWFLRIVLYRSMNARKARGVRERHSMAEVPDVGGGVAEMSGPERSEVRARFAAALEELPEQQRLVVQLADVDGYSSQDIGVMLDMPSGTVRWHLHGARAALRRVLAPLRAEGSTHE